MSSCTLLEDDSITYIRVYNLSEYDVDSLKVDHYKIGNINRGEYSEYLTFENAETNIDESFQVKIGSRWFGFGPADEMGLPKLKPHHYTLEYTSITTVEHVKAIRFKTKLIEE